MIHNTLFNAQLWWPFLSVYAFPEDWKTGKNLKEDFMKKGREKGEKEKSDKKHMLKYLYEA